MRAGQKISHRAGAKGRPKRLWNKKMEREHESRWQREGIRRLIKGVITEPINYDDIPILSPQELRELAAKQRSSSKCAGDPLP